MYCADVAHDRGGDLLQVGYGRGREEVLDGRSVVSQERLGFEQQLFSGLDQRGVIGLASVLPRDSPTHCDSRDVSTTTPRFSTRLEYLVGVGRRCTNRFSPPSDTVNGSYSTLMPEIS